MIKFNYSDYELVTYYRYTTSVQDRLFETNYMLDSDKLDRCGKDLKNLFDCCCLEAERLTEGTDVHWMQDNKCAFKIRHKKSGKELFIGFYDCAYALGLSICQYFGSRLDFETMTWSQGPKGTTSEYNNISEY